MPGRKVLGFPLGAFSQGVELSALRKKGVEFMSLNPTNVQVKKSRLHRLDAYLVAGVGVAGMASTANAAVVSIDMTPYSAVNGGGCCRRSDEYRRLHRRRKWQNCHI